MRARPRAYGGEVLQHYRTLDELRATASDRQTSCASLALAWVIGHPDCTAPVVGPSRAAPHLGHVSEAVRLRLASDEHRRIEDRFGRSE